MSPMDAIRSATSVNAGILGLADRIGSLEPGKDADVILIDTLELETLDLEELRASFEAIGLALVQHYKLLGRYREKN